VRSCLAATATGNWNDVLFLATGINVVAVLLVLFVSARGKSPPCGGHGRKTDREGTFRDFRQFIGVIDHGPAA